MAVSVGALVLTVDLNGARGAIGVAEGELSTGAELGTALAVAVTASKAPLLVAVGNLSGDVAFGVLLHEATLC